jgi:hypothetical protein
MNTTREEFRRALVQAFGDAVQEDAAGLLLTTVASILHFATSNEEPVQIGALKIPMLRVEISIRAGSEASAQSLLERVDRATMRGGG